MSESTWSNVNDIPMAIELGVASAESIETASGGFILVISNDISPAQAQAFFDEFEHCQKIEQPSGYFLNESR